MAAIFSIPLITANRVPIQNAIVGPIQFLGIPRFPTMDRLWTVLADTRRIRRSLEIEPENVHLGITDVPEMIQKLRDYERKVMGILRTQGATV
jgi:hypothetical protein